MATRRPSQSQFALLGLLELGPMSGYQMRQLIDDSIGHFWHEGWGQIYPTLKQLVADGAVTRARKRGKGRPDRQVYRITDRGRARVREWLAIPVSPEVPRNELLLKLFFGSQAEVEHSMQHVTRFRFLLHDQQVSYAAIEARLAKKAKGHPQLPFWRMTLSFGRHRVEAMIAWCDETLHELYRLDGTKQNGAGQDGSEQNRTGQDGAGQQPTGQHRPGKDGSRKSRTGKERATRNKLQPSG